MTTRGIRQPPAVGHAALDVSGLPDHGAFGPNGLVWWGTTGYMVIEGSMFVMGLIVYFYLRLRVDAWPPSLPNPDLFWGSINLLILLISIVPNHLSKLAAERCDRRKTLMWLIVCTAIGVVMLIVRGLELPSLNCRWDDNAYGSVVWCLMVLHTLHLLTEVFETGVLTVLMYTGPVDTSRFVDVSHSALYWYFVVAWWVPIYLTVYFAPRWL